MATSVALATAPSVRRRGQLYVALAALAWSSAGVLQRELSVGTPTQLAGRAFFAAVALAALVAVQTRGRLLGAFRLSRGEVGVAIATAVASGSFIVALNHARVANVLFLQALSPVIAAAIAWLLLGERISMRTIVAMGGALVGVGVMVGGPGGMRGIGLVLSIVMTTAFAVALVLTRHRNDVSMAPALCVSQLIVCVCSAPFSHPGSASGRDLLLLMGLGVGQIGLGSYFITIGGRLIPAAEVALITLLEIVLGPLWVWLVLSERPSTSTLIGGVIVLASVAGQAGGSGRPTPI
ncbi:MAG TPA: DMT family transporter [Gaiellaceae bacterium]|nr:DMT family transporter [Gaiellaceae bacterium]